MESRKLTRDEQKARRDLEKLFHAGLKQQAKATGWGFLKPTSFRRMGEWFVTVDPVVWTDAERSQLHIKVKPFVIDDLMAKIMSLKGLDDTPLSLRARGPHCLVRSMFVTDVEAGGDIDKMLELSSVVFEEVESKIDLLSIDDFIVFSVDDVPSGKMSVNQIAALILAQRSDEARTLCEQAIEANQQGGPSRITDCGQIVSFFECCVRWLSDSIH
jgi:hypothetical protein